MAKNYIIEAITHCDNSIKYIKSYLVYDLSLICAERKEVFI